MQTNCSGWRPGSELSNAWYGLAVLPRTSASRVRGLLTAASPMECRASWTPFPLPSPSRRGLRRQDIPVVCPVSAVVFQHQAAVRAPSEPSETALAAPCEQLCIPSFASDCDELVRGLSDQFEVGLNSQGTGFCNFDIQLPQAEVIAENTPVISVHAGIPRRWAYFIALTEALYRARGSGRGTARCTNATAFSSSIPVG